MSLPKTYLLRFGVPGQAAQFQPLLCQGNAEALAAARRALEERTDCETIDVLLGDTEIFQLVRAD